MFTRRHFFLSSAAAFAAPGGLTPRERVRRALRGEDVDRPPFSFWHHFLDESLPGDRHARSTLEFHRKFRTDLVKVMSDYPYPKPPLKVEQNPFPEQVRALEIIRESLGGSAYFVETIFNPYNQAEKAASAEEVARLRREKPQALLDMLEAIAKSEANHARRAVGAGAAGVFLAIANSEDPEYAKFSEPFDKLILDSVRSAPLNILHLHGDKLHPARFYKGWSASVINYSPHATGISISEVRRGFPGVLMCGIDERNYRTLLESDLREQWHTAQQAAGKRFILAPGCSVPNESTDAELDRLPGVLGA